MATQDYYEILGVSRSASPDEIQRAYRKLARTWHPDVNASPEAEDRFKDLSEAYDALSDPRTRARYDAFGDDFRKVPDDVDPAAYASGQRRAGRSRASSDGAPGHDGFGHFDGASGDTLEDLLGGMFGQSRRSNTPRTGPDQEVQIDLSVAEAYRGGKRSISLTGSSGARNYTVTVPAGVIDGQRIRLGGQGAAGRNGGAPGDLYLIVRLLPDPRFRLHGRDITVDVAVSPWEAALGATVAVETPGGDAKIKVPPGSSSGQKLRLRGRGMPRTGGADGDLFAALSIVIPKQLTDEERALFRQLDAISTFEPRSAR